MEAFFIWKLVPWRVPAIKFSMKCLYIWRYICKRSRALLKTHGACKMTQPHQLRHFTKA